MAFTVEGYVGHQDTLTTVNALINMFVIGTIAIAATDLIAQQLSEEFAAEKYEDDGERAALDMLLEKEAVRLRLHARRLFRATRLSFAHWARAR